jgi:Flp pilus assembly protein TadG
MMRTLNRYLPAALLRRFSGDEAGVALVEAAFVFPLMILMYLGSVAITMGVTTDRKLTLLARSLGDIVAQGTTITSAQIDDIFESARAVMYPYNSSTAVLRMRVSNVRINAAGTLARVCWSLSHNGGYTRGPGDDVTNLIPEDLRIANSYLIVPEVEYDYDPVVGADITGGRIVLKDVLFMRARQSTQVTSFNEPSPPQC